ncbi:MAG: GAF domain-containing SpoIIE family protein phosphatase [Acidobacteriaceae bacterium]
MPSVQLRTLLRPRSSSFSAVASLCEALDSGICIVDASGKELLGTQDGAPNDSARATVEHEGITLGTVIGKPVAATTVASLLSHLAAREVEGRALAGEVLHLYREIHLIEELSEHLAALLDLSAIGQLALAQAQRLISATEGTILVMDRAKGSLASAASFGLSDENLRDGCHPLGPGSLLVTSVLERGVAEIVNRSVNEAVTGSSATMEQALICAPLRAGERMAGVIALGDSAAKAAYSSADLKLLNTIALQTATAMENSMLCAEMVNTARDRAAYAAELQAASTVQQLLLQSASGATPGFHVDSVYLPASEVGGDFFFVQPAPDGSLVAVVGDVSGKGLTAAMRVAMILGALRRETSHEPDAILFALNNVLISQGQLGFTTACCVKLSLSGEYTLANAGHIAPYLEGQEIETPPTLPLGLVADQRYEQVGGRLVQGERLVLLSDGVPEARSTSGELYGFERLSALSRMPASEIAETAQRFGQEDDITVLTLGLHPAANSPTAEGC